MGRLKLAVLISGRGSNLQSLIDACMSPDFPAEIEIVISNRPDAFGIERAKKAGLKTLIIDHKNFSTREEFEDTLHDTLHTQRVDLVCLAGFMRVLTSGFVNKWSGRMVNIHPSLLPKFKGLHTHERAIEAQEKESGCTIHYVTAEMDDGPIIVQRKVAISPDETPESLAAKVLLEEHIAYPAAIHIIAQDLLKK